MDITTLGRGGSDTTAVALAAGKDVYLEKPMTLTIDEGKKIDFVLAIGPVPMMKAVAEVTRPHGIKTVVSLNPIMVDGTGMCGGCRVTVGGEVKFACVDGPFFDAHEVDFKQLADRLAMYRDVEKDAYKVGSCMITGLAVAGFGAPQ